jgi:aspartate/glutamate racemase
MLVQQQHIEIPLFDTTVIHAEEAVLEAVRQEDALQQMP